MTYSANFLTEAFKIAAFSLSKRENNPILQDKVILYFTLNFSSSFLMIYFANFS